MTTTTVFFDLYYTLVYFNPPREHRLSLTLREFGFEVGETAIRRAYLAADHFYTQAGMETPIHLLSHEAREALYHRYQQVVMVEIGLGHALHMTDAIYRRYWEEERVLQLYQDVEPALEQLKAEGYRLGLITNVSEDPAGDLERLGIRGFFDAVAASCLVGADKPDPRIFKAAMEQLGIGPGEGVHVGDQLLADAQGAQGAGLTGILLDRYDLQEGRHPLRVRGLGDVAPLLRNGRA